ncbi:MAG: KH domain-containing protein, partial [Dehalococcoidia bacterium]|nr:KH domain-containing protein [Dehalococcoidia bacterium]
EIIDAARDTIETLLRLMRLNAETRVAATTTVTEEDNSEFTVEITGPDLGLLIGRRGDTLAALQYLLNLIVAKRVGAPVRIAVDVEGYRKRRAQSLRSLALRMAERAQQYRQPVTLEAMPPNERRLIHLALRNHPTVTSQSIGEGDDRKVVISPKR